MLEPPIRFFVFEISDPTHENSPTHSTQDVDEAKNAYEKGFFVSINEVVQSPLSSRQKVTTIITTDWDNKTNINE
ncbi:MAG: hypothetical protein LBJ00_03770 [Planctomycetaceae bacterium]|jgi:hypothetical protein|nr:hypothetical protein [Planctomycetaceae bacterium]